jgi:peptidase M23-like protein
MNERCAVFAMKLRPRLLDLLPRSGARRPIDGLLALLLVGVPLAAGAAPPALMLPLACAPNRDCWIANHVDLDPGPGIRDYACGALTYHGHKGTDFAIRDRAAMADGVAVLAAAAGRVRAGRDGIADVSVREAGKESIKSRECGNGVVLEHGDGWETQYCHLRRGSLRVKAGEEVAAGQALGLVGLSGLTEYPHLHLSVRHKDKVIDPFRGEQDSADCSAGNPLWRGEVAAVLPYAPGAVYNAGFAPELPDATGVRSGRYRNAGVLSAGARVVAFYAEVFGVSAGDTLELRLTGPDGATLAERRVPIAERQARRFAYIGVRRTAAAWKPGVYRGEARLVHTDGSRSPASSRAASVEMRD